VIRALIRAHASLAASAHACALACALALSLCFARGAGAQDFASPAPAGRGGTPGAFLERALPEARPVFSFEMLAIAWDPAAELTTRALAGLTIWRGLSCGAGLSSTGDGVVGWNSVALAVGHASATHGAATRVLVRRDRAAPDPDHARLIGAEAGAGFWSVIGSRGRIWASAPMALTAGESAPLDRGLETGVSFGAREWSGWLSWAAPAGAVDAAERALGLACETGPKALWAEARDRPLRTSISLRARRGAITVLAQVSEHPVLGETARCSLGIGGAGP
jgi:hypothetical protein